MSNYRIFFLDHAAKIVGAEVIMCASDADALRMAGGYLGSHPAIEVWQLARRVGQISGLVKDLPG